MNRIEEKFVANLEEVQGHPPSAWEDAPLILFTLLGQMAVGCFWAMLWMFPRLWTHVEHDTSFLHLLPFLLVGVCLSAGMLASLAHLGTKRNAWRALGQLRRSWLSREILFTGLFGAGWLLTTLENLIWHRSTMESLALTAALGLGLVNSMSNVYRLRAVPAWNTWRTNVGFIVSGLLLGQSALATLLAYESNLTGSLLRSSQWLVMGSLLILLSVQLSLLQKRFSRYPFHEIRVGFLLVGMALSIMSPLVSGAANTGVNASILLMIVLEEAVGRWLFYQART